MPAASPLATDLYELNMVQAYLDRGEDGTAVFEFFVRRLPERRGFLLAAGLDDALDYLETLRFSAAEIDWLKGTGRFRADLLDYLASFRFTGDVHAIPEGTACFPNEPLIRITAPLPQAQLVETRLINILHFQTMVASKAARMVLAAPGKVPVDFGLRTAHGAEAGLYSARASYIAGFAGAANVAAGAALRHPGRRHHGALLHPGARRRGAGVRELRARAAGRRHPADRHLRHRGRRAESRRAGAASSSATASRSAACASTAAISPRSARKVRAILDAGGLQDVIILVSGGINEDVLQVMMREQARRSTASASASISTPRSTRRRSIAPTSCRNSPAGRGASAPRARRPGRAASRCGARYDADGRMRGDVLSVESDSQAGEPLIVPVMRGGKRLGAGGKPRRHPRPRRARTGAPAGRAGAARAGPGLSGHRRRRAGGAGARGRPPQHGLSCAGVMAARRNAGGATPFLPQSDGRDPVHARSPHPFVRRRQCPQGGGHPRPRAEG